MILGNIRNLKKYLVPLSVVIICIYALYLRLMKLAAHDLWIDEIYQINTAMVPFFDFIKSLPTIEHCPYISGDYFLTYPFARIFHYNKWALAIPHVIATVLGLYLLYPICKKYFKTYLGYLVAFGIVCFNSTLTYHATEVRPYAVLPTLALAVFYFGGILVEQYNQLNIKKKIAIGALFILTIWFHVYGIIILFAPLSFHLAVNFNRPGFRITTGKIIKFIAVVLCIAMPLWLYSVFGPHKPTNIYNVFEYIPNPLANPLGFLKAVFGNLIGYKKFYFLLIGLFFPFIIRYQERVQQIAFVIITVFIPIGFLLGVAVATKYWFLQRQFIWVMPYFAFFLGWTWDSFFCYFFGRRFYKKC